MRKKTRAHKPVKSKAETGTTAQTAQSETKRESDAKKERFLEAAGGCATILAAAKASGVSRRSHYFWLENDPSYAEAFRYAREDYLDKLTEECDRRAIKGVNKPVFHQGMQCGTIPEFSDSLLMFRMKRLDPAYRERFDGTVKVEAGFDADSLQASGQDSVWQGIS